MRHAAEIDDFHLSRVLERASRRAGVTPNTREMLTVLRAGSAVVAAPIQGLERVPATALREGVDVGFGYFDLPSPDLPPGFYRVNVSAEVGDVGQTTGRARLVDDRGGIGLEVPATVEVTSLQLPPRPLFPNTVLTASIQREDDQAPARYVIAICWVCPNGWIACIVFVWKR